MNRKKNPIMKMVNIRMTLKQQEALRRKSFDTNLSMSKIVRDILERQRIIPPTVENIS